MKMRMEDELWLKKIKNRLEDYSAPVPASGWERLEKELSASSASRLPMRRALPFRRWAVAAAAALLVAISSISLWLLQSPVADEVRHTSSALAVVPDVLPAQAEAEAQSRQEAPLAQHRSLVADGKDDVNRSSAVMEEALFDRQSGEVPEAETEEGERVAADDARATEDAAEKAPSEEAAKRNPVRYRLSGKEKPRLPVRKKSAVKGWTVGLSVGNPKGLSGGQGDMDWVQSSAQPGGIQSDFVSIFNMNGMSNGQEIVVKDGMITLQQRPKNVASASHKQPISFGVSVRKNLKYGLSVESGLTYTYLASDIVFEGWSEEVSQKLHYVGIPLRANWSFLENGDFSMYVSAGGAVEKCVYGKMGSEKATVKPLQFSVMGAVGAQYNISRRIGLYVEPGISHYFDDGSSVQTIRKENPCNFTLQAGVRLMY